MKRCPTGLAIELMLPVSPAVAAVGAHLGPNPAGAVGYFTELVRHILAALPAK